MLNPYGIKASFRIPYYRYLIPKGIALTIDTG